MTLSEQVQKLENENAVLRNAVSLAEMTCHRIGQLTNFPGDKKLLDFQPDQAENNLVKHVAALVRKLPG